MDTNLHYPFTLPPLPYSYSALEPYIDSRTMQLHHDKHLGKYIDNLNNILKEYPEYQHLSLEDLICQNYTLPYSIQTEVCNNAGGIVNHIMYFNIMTPSSKKEPTGSLLAAIEDQFCSFDAFKERFSTCATKLFGSGYTFLCKDKYKKLKIINLPNQSTPLLLDLKTIVLIDVWEHAYYLKYQNRRAEYIENFFNVINWDIAKEMFE